MMSAPNLAPRAKQILAAAAFVLGATGFAHDADARPGGCIKGAIVGGVAGHFVGHGGVGAAAGCAYGIHRRHEYDRQDLDVNEGRSGSDRGRDNY